VKKLWFILFYIIFQLLSCSDSHKTKFDVVIVDSQKDILPRYVDINELQDRLLEQNAVLIYYKDVNRNHPCYKAVQYFGLQGIIPEWEVHPDKPLTEIEKEQLIDQAKIEVHGIDITKPITKGELLNILYNSIKK